MKLSLVDFMGDDLTVVNAARVSFGRWKEDFEPKDARLIKYLAEHKHASPFRTVIMQAHVKIPLWLRAQWVKHQVGADYTFKDTSSNEISRRYVDSEPGFHIPDWRQRPKEGIKQGSGREMDSMECHTASKVMTDTVVTCKQAYIQLLDMGVAPEQARAVLPQATYTEFVVTGSLEYWAHMYRLRSGTFGHPQKEWEPLMKSLNIIMKSIAPRSWEALI